MYGKTDVDFNGICPMKVRKQLASGALFLRVFIVSI